MVIDVEGPGAIARPAAAIDLIADELASGDLGAGMGERIALRLEQAIRSGVLGEGERLPNEAELAEQLGVSSLTLRQALAALRAQGLIETRRGRAGGSFIAAQADASESLAEGLSKLSPIGIRELVDLAAAIGERAARLAAHRADEADVERLGLVADELGTAATAGEARQRDARFHVGLCIASHSGRISRLAPQVMGELASMTWLAAWTTAERDAHAAEHAAIVAAIADGREDAAAELVRRHFESIEAEVLASYHGARARRRREGRT